MNIRSIQDDEVFDMYVGSLIICCKPSRTNTFSITFPCRLDLSCNTNFLIWHLNLQLTQLGMGYFDTSFPSLITCFQRIFHICLGFNLGICIKK